MGTQTPDQSKDESIGNDLPFTVTAETTLSRRERAKRTTDRYLLAPVRIIWSDWRARIGFLIIALFVLIGTVGVYFVPVPRANPGPQYVPPFTTWEYPLGTGQLGNGIFEQLVHATPEMLQMIMAGAVFSTAVATLLGTLAGYKGGIVDRSIMVLADIVMTIPGLPLVIILAAILQPENPYLIGLILGINNWGGLTRAVRSQVLSIRERSFVEASRTMGLSTPTILRDDIIPDVMPYISVHFVMSSRNIIFESVGLYFLGILPFTTQNWGVMMNLAYSTSGALYSLKSAHWLFAPMLTITLFSLGLILFAQGMDRLFNPRVRARHVTSADTDEEDDQVSPTTNVPMNQ